MMKTRQGLEKRGMRSAPFSHFGVSRCCVFREGWEWPQDCNWCVLSLGREDPVLEGDKEEEERRGLHTAHWPQKVSAAL